MPRRLANLVAILVLAVHGVVSLAPGRVLCVSLFDADLHDADATLVERCPCDSHACESTPGTREGESGGSGGIARSPLNQCDCHLHVLIPAGEQLPPRASAQGGESDQSVPVMPVVAIAFIEWHPAPPSVCNPRFRTPDSCAGDNARIVRTTRLLI